RSPRREVEHTATAPLNRGRARDRRFGAERIPAGADVGLVERVANLGETDRRDYPDQDHANHHLDRGEARTPHDSLLPFASNTYHMLCHCVSYCVIVTYDDWLLRKSTANCCTCADCCTIRGRTGPFCKTGFASSRRGASRPRGGCRPPPA